MLLTERHTRKHTQTHTHTHTDRQTQTHRQTDRHTPGTSQWCSSWWVMETCGACCGMRLQWDSLPTQCEGFASLALWRSCTLTAESLQTYDPTTTHRHRNYINNVKKLQQRETGDRRNKRNEVKNVTILYISHHWPQNAPLQSLIHKSHPQICNKIWAEFQPCHIINSTKSEFCCKHWSVVGAGQSQHWPLVITNPVYTEWPPSPPFNGPVSTSTWPPRQFSLGFILLLCWKKKSPMTSGSGFWQADVIAVNQTVTAGDSKQGSQPGKSSNDLIRTMPTLWDLYLERVNTASQSQTAVKSDSTVKPQSVFHSHLITCDVLHFLDNFGFLIGAVQVGYVARVEDHADVFHETLIFYLTVGDEEHRLTTVTARLQQQLHTHTRDAHFTADNVNSLTYINKCTQIIAWVKVLISNEASSLT